LSVTRANDFVRRLPGARYRFYTASLPESPNAEGLAMKKWIWTFVALVACLDVEFFYRCQDSMLDWESNPVARWMFGSCGLPGIVLYRVSLLAFAVVMSCTRTRWSWLVAPVWGSGHAYLLVTLFLTGPYIGALRATPSFDAVAQAGTLDARPNGGHRSEQHDRFPLGEFSP
jgi:hypothetical protein